MKHVFQSLPGHDPEQQPTNTAAMSDVNTASNNDATNTSLNPESTNAGDLLLEVSKLREAGRDNEANERLAEYARLTQGQVPAAQESEISKDNSDVRQNPELESLAAPHPSEMKSAEGAFAGQPPALVDAPVSATATAPISINLQQPSSMKPRQRRTFLRVQLGHALEGGDISLAARLNEELSVLDKRADRRAERDSTFRRSDCEHPYDQSLMSVYAEWSIKDVLIKYQKAIRWDSSHLGLVGGTANEIQNALMSVGAHLDPEVLRAIVIEVAWGKKRRIAGLGQEFCRDANQVLRMEAEQLGRGRIPEAAWLRRKPLPDKLAWIETDFAKDWNEWVVSHRKPEQPMPDGVGVIA